jgi:hypothetical protein
MTPHAAGARPQAPRDFDAINPDITGTCLRCGK